MTPQEWKEADEKLKLFYNTVKLNCDGYQVTLVLEHIGQFQNAIMVYVNGKFEEKWMMGNCEESRRFLFPKRSFVYKQKLRAELKKLQKRTRRENRTADADAKIIIFSPQWTSFNALKRHLIKNNQSIELIKEKS